MTAIFRFAIVVLPASILLSAAVGSAAIVTLPGNRDNNISRTDYQDVFPRPLYDVNFGGSPAFQIGDAGGDDVRSIVGFDVSSLGVGLVQSVTLRLTFEATNSSFAGSAVTVDVYQISAANAGWVEGTGGQGVDGTGGDLNSGSTWYYKDRTTDNWASVVGSPSQATGGLAVAGVDYDLPLLATHTFAQGTDPNSIDGTVFDFEFQGTTAELTALVTGWQVVNPGFLLLSPADVPNNNRAFFASRNNDTEAARPQLIVTLVPEPTSALLLGIGLVGLGLSSRRNRMPRWVLVN